MELEHLEQTAQTIGRIIGEAMRGADGKPVAGFCLIMTELYTDKGFFTYVSNCEREDMINLLKEAIVKIERKGEI